MTGARKLLVFLKISFTMVWSCFSISVYLHLLIYICEIPNIIANISLYLNVFKRVSFKLVFNDFLNPWYLN